MLERFRRSSMSLLAPFFRFRSDCELEQALQFLLCLAIDSVLRGPGGFCTNYIQGAV